MSQNVFHINRYKIQVPHSPLVLTFEALIHYQTLPI